MYTKSSEISSNFKEIKSEKAMKLIESSESWVLNFSSYHVNISVTGLVHYSSSLDVNKDKNMFVIEAIAPVHEKACFNGTPTVKNSMEIVGKLGFAHPYLEDIYDKAKYWITKQEKIYLNETNTQIILISNDPAFKIVINKNTNVLDEFQQPWYWESFKFIKYEITDFELEIENFTECNNLVTRFLKLKNPINNYGVLA